MIKDFKSYDFSGGTVRVAKTAIAFANGAGGKIVFGVRSEPREIAGVPDDGLFSLEEKISNHIGIKKAPAEPETDAGHRTSTGQVPDKCKA